MEQIITAKLKLTVTPEEHSLLRRTQLAYRDSLNFASQWSFQNGKTSSQMDIHSSCYSLIREKFSLPAQMACSVSRTVGSTYKSLWTKLKQNLKSKKAGHTKKRYKGLDKPPCFSSPVVSYVLGRDYGFKKDCQVGLTTLEGRINLKYEGYSKHIELLQESKNIGGAKLWYDKPKKKFYLLVSIIIQKQDPIFTDHKQVIGVDVGLRYLAVATNTKQESIFFSGKTVRHKANQYARLRKKLQQKGTRNSKIRLIAISGRERRLKLDTNHKISKAIINLYPQAIIGLEELSGIRDRTKRKKGKKASVKQRKSNAVYSKWAFSELHNLLAYKSVLNGSMTVKVDADYTSKACPCCGHTSSNNRPNKGLMFECENCHFKLHSDLVGARNIALRTLFVRQDWMKTGVLSVRPNVSNYEAKAERLQRYSELRWSLDTSPLF